MTYHRRDLALNEPGRLDKTLAVPYDPNRDESQPSSLNVLLISPAIPQTFWSLERTIRMVGVKAVVPPLGLLTLAAMHPREWNLWVVDQTFQTISEEHWARCDLVLITGQVVQSTGILENISEAKRRGKYVVVGGPWVFHCPEKIIKEGADIVVVGEAEPVWDRLLEAITRQQTGLILVAKEMSDMTKSPAPRYEFINHRDYAIMALQFTRGCPFNCNFCDVTHMLGHKVRHKTTAQILQELQAIYDLGFRGFVFFVDDNFIGNLPAAQALLQELIHWMQKRNHPFRFITQASVNMSNHDDLLRDMYVAGFRKVFLGIETPDVDSLKQARKHQNVSHDSEEACRKITRAGFQIIAGVMLGFDNEKTGAGERLMDLAIRNNIPELFATLLQAPPGTDLYQRLEKEQRLLPMNTEYMSNQTGLPNFIPTRPLSQLTNEFVKLYWIMYEPAAFTRRLYRNLSSMNPPHVSRPFRWPNYREWKALGNLIWRQGILYPSRGTFWICFFKMLFLFPDRIDGFITSCVMEEHYRAFRDVIVNKIGAQITALSPVEKRRYYSTAAKQVLDECIAAGPEVRSPMLQSICRSAVTTCSERT